MKVFKNLFGDGSKIHADEIVVGNENNNKTLTNKLKEYDELTVTNSNGPTTGTKTITLPNNGLFLLMVSVGASSSSNIGIYFIQTFGRGFAYMHSLKEIGYNVTVELNHRTLTISRSGSYGYALVQFWGNEYVYLSGIGRWK